MPVNHIPGHLRLRLGNGNAPHKPILLLAVLHAFDDGLITENRISPEAELIDLFLGYWSELVHSDRYQPRFFLPFFHLRNEASRSWKLHTSPGFEEHALTSTRSVKSLGALIAFHAWAELRPDIFHRWCIAANREMDRSILMTAYFFGQQIANGTAQPYAVF